MRRGLGSCILVALVILLAAATIHINHVYGVALTPTASVVGVDYPRSVRASSQFQVTISVDYSDKFLADVGIWNSQSGKIVQSVTLISNTTGPGESNFTFQITAPSSSGDWNLVAVTRVWWQNAWYSANSGTFPFVIQVFTSSSVSTLTITSNGNATITVDGVALPVTAEPVSVQVQNGIHSIEATPRISDGSNQRLVFVSWTDGITANPRRIVIDQDTMFSASYRIEYFLNVQSPNGLTTGGGWYVDGSQASFAAIQSYAVSSWFGILTQYYTFSGWTGDTSASDVSASILMNSPKTVTASWIQTSTLDIAAVGDIFIILAIPLAARAIYSEVKRRQPNIHDVARIFRRGSILTLFGLIIVGLIVVPTVNADLPIQSQASVVRIGDADWYYWGKASSNTCILWLGGGIQESGSGTSYAINPFDYESFGTIRFMQDLSQYYCVLALQKGSSESFDPVSNRTIYQEPYQGESTIISEVHDWIIHSGYEHTFLIGYSVGGEAAVTEMTVRDPASWTASDGIILITVPLPNDAIEAAPNIHASVMLLYGGNLPDYEATGMQFYQAAPNEGWHGSYYYHKEFHVFQYAGHEVWTVRNTGAYDPQALDLTVNFIETCKSLQLKQFSLQQPNGTFNVTSVLAPEKIAPGQVFTIQVNFTSITIPTTPTVLIAYDKVSHEILSTASVGNESTGIDVILVIPASNMTTLELSIMIVQQDNQIWLPVSLPYDLTIPVTDLVTLTLNTSIPNATVIFDGATYSTPDSGQLRIDAPIGSHTLEVQPISYVDNSTRSVFVEWEDSSSANPRAIVLDQDTQVYAVYQTQYFVSVSSPYGNTTGSGWYDEGSTDVGTVQPIVLQQPPVIFSHWEQASTDTSPATTFTVNSPTTLVAVWSQTTNTVISSDFEKIAWLAVSILLFTLMLAWNLRLNLTQDYSKPNNLEGPNGRDRENLARRI